MPSSSTLLRLLVVGLRSIRRLLPPALKLLAAPWAMAALALAVPPWQGLGVVVAVEARAAGVKARAPVVVARAVAVAPALAASQAARSWPALAARQPARRLLLHKPEARRRHQGKKTR